MAAPAPQNRLAPPGRHLSDGMSTVVAFELDTAPSSATALRFWDITVKPMGISQREKIDQTTMWNQDRHTFAPRYLYEVTDCEVQCAYNPQFLTKILEMVGVVQVISVIFSNGDKWSDYGWISAFEPDANEEGTMPRATITVVFGGEDPDDCYNEAEPVFTDLLTGTCN